MITSFSNKNTGIKPNKKKSGCRPVEDPVQHIAMHFRESKSVDQLLFSCFYSSKILKR